MSEIIGLIGFDATDIGSADRWSFSNANAHSAVHAAVQAQGYGNPVVSEIYPVRWDNLGGWELRHQQMHDQINEALGVAGTDLTGVDFSDKAKADQWHKQHFDEHAAWQAILG